MDTFFTFRLPAIFQTYRNNCWVLVLTFYFLHIHMQAIGQDIPTVVESNSSVNLRYGSQGVLPCATLSRETVFASWHKGNYVAGAELISIDMYYIVGKKSGHGYEKGLYDITDDFSLVIKRVTREDEGRYLCATVDDPISADVVIHPTNLSVYVPPEEPFPIIEECLNQTGGQNCTLVSSVSVVNITCTVSGFYPSVSLQFHHRSQVVLSSASPEWINVDGTKNTSVIIRAFTSSRPEPYICKAKCIDSSGEIINERLATIHLEWMEDDLLKGKHNRPKEIGIILVLFCISIVFPLVILYTLFARVNNRNSRRDSLEGDALLIETEMERRPSFKVYDCKAELLSYYRHTLGGKKRSPLDAHSALDIKSNYTRLHLLKDPFGKLSDNEDFINRFPGFLRSKKRVGGSKFRNMQTETLREEEFLFLLSPNTSPYRILLVGEPGVGKTTFSEKLITNWMDGTELESTDLLFHIPLADQNDSEHTAFYKTVQQFMSSKDISSEIDEYIDENQRKVMFFLDGLDDFEGNITEPNSQNVLVKLIRGEKYSESVVVVTARPWCAYKILEDEKLRKLYTFIAVVDNFDKKNVKEYVERFFAEKQESGKNLVHFLEEDSKKGGIFSTEVVTVPMYLAMLCHMWNETLKQDVMKELKNVSQLMHEMFKTLLDHARKHMGDISVTSNQDAYRCFINIGGLAYKGVLSNQLAVKCNACECQNNADFIKLASTLGILTKEDRIKPLLRGQTQKEMEAYEKHCVFSHKLLQTYLAAMYIADLHESNFQKFQTIVNHLLDKCKDDPDRFEHLWYFLVAHKKKKVGKYTLEHLCRRIKNRDFLIRVSFEAQDPTSHLKRSLRMKKLRSLAAYKYNMEMSNQLDSVFVDVLPDSETVAFSFGHAIFSLQSVRVVEINRCTSYNAEKFYGAMEEVSSLSKIRVLSHLNDTLGSNASRLYAQSLKAMTNLQVVRLQNVHVDDVFYSTLNDQAHSLRIKTMILYILDLKLGPDPSRELAEAIVTMPSLQNLDLYTQSLDNVFYEVLAEGGSDSRISNVNLYAGKNLDRDGSCNLSRGLSKMNLNTMLLNVESLDEACFAEFCDSTACLNTEIKRLGIPGGSKLSDEACRNLVKGISTMHGLESIYLIQPGDVLLTQLCLACSMETDLESISIRNISTIILKKAKLTQRSLHHLLQHQTLRCVRFTQVTAQGVSQEITSIQHGSLDNPTQACQVEDIRIDDVSLPHVLKLGVNKLCRRVKKIQLDFTRDVKDQDIRQLEQFLSATVANLYLVAYSIPGTMYNLKVSLQDTSTLRKSIARSWSHISTLVISDIDMGNKETERIADMVPDLKSIENLTITRCDTTDDLVLHSKVVHLTNGKPCTQENHDDDLYADYLRKMDQAFFDALFKVIV